MTQHRAPYSLQTPQLVETAIDDVITMLRSGYNEALKAVWAAYNQGSPSDAINLPGIENDRWYDTEVIDPLQLPAGFVIADRSEHDMHAQNFELTTHHLAVVILIEDVEITRLTRAIYRCTLAAWNVLHDKAFHNTYTRQLGEDYSPAYTRRATDGSRKFRKDVTIRVEAKLYEPF